MNAPLKHFAGQRTTPSPRGLIYRRIVEEVCTVTGSGVAEQLVLGERLRLGKQLFSFLHDEEYHPSAMFVYVDLGPPPEKDSALRDVLKLNFDLLAGTQGVMSIHPDTGNLFYSMRYPLGLASSGVRLMDGLTRSLEEIAAAMAPKAPSGPKAVNRRRD